MPTYRFYLTADQMQDEIWRYTFNRWGEAQADKYIRELHQHLQQIANKDIFWKSLPADIVVPSDLNIEVYMSHYVRHYIFFREFANGDIGIMSILHDVMDIPVRLREDLSRIKNKE